MRIAKCALVTGRAHEAYKQWMYMVSMQPSLFCKSKLQRIDVIIQVEAITFKKRFACVSLLPIWRKSS